jgi:hypothetical protein
LRDNIGCLCGVQADSCLVHDPSVGRVTRELEVGQAHVFYHDLIGSNIRRRLKVRYSTRTTRTAGSVHCSRRNEVVLIDAVSANSEAANQHVISIQRKASRKKDDSAFVAGIRRARFRSLRTRNFSLTSTCGSLTVVPGQMAIYTVDLAPVNGFTKSVSLTCSGAPSLANCTVSPSSITLDGSATIQAQVTATTTPPTSGSLRSPFGQDRNRTLAEAGLASMMGLAALVILPFKRRMKGRRFYGLIFFLCMLSTIATLSSCGIGGGDPPGTAAGTYPLTVTGTYRSTTGTSFTQTVSFNLVVQ